MAQRQRRIMVSAVLLFGVAAGMVGASFAAVPLYRMFCQLTGYAGTPRTENITRTDRVADRMVTVRFDANVNSKLPWAFQPLQKRIEVRPGEDVLVHYEATNRGGTAVTGTATFNVMPDTVGKYFNKIECFCFTEQTLNPGESISMPVMFFVDPAIFDDPETAGVTTITLSYTFFPVDGPQPSGAAAAAPARAGDS
jgi:cytochrome c oxidase assembly protein subunit 11